MKKHLNWAQIAYQWSFIPLALTLMASLEPVYKFSKLLIVIVLQWEKFEVTFYTYILKHVFALIQIPIPAWLPSITYGLTFYIYTWVLCIVFYFGRGSPSLTTISYRQVMRSDRISNLAALVSICICLSFFFAAKSSQLAEEFNNLTDISNHIVIDIRSAFFGVSVFLAVTYVLYQLFGSFLRAASSFLGWDWTSRTRSVLFVVATVVFVAGLVGVLNVYLSNIYHVESLEILNDDASSVDLIGPTEDRVLVFLVSGPFLLWLYLVSVRDREVMSANSVYPEFVYFVVGFAVWVIGIVTLSTQQYSVFAVLWIAVGYPVYMVLRKSAFPYVRIGLFILGILVFDLIIKACEAAFAAAHSSGAGP